MSRWDAMKSSPPSANPYNGIVANQSNRPKQFLLSHEEKKDTEIMDRVSRSTRVRQARDSRPRQLTYTRSDRTHFGPTTIVSSASTSSDASGSRKAPVPPLLYVERAWLVETLTKELLFFQGSGGFSSLPGPVLRNCVSKLRLFGSAETGPVVLLLVDLLQITHTDIDVLVTEILEEKLEASSRISTMVFTQPQSQHIVKTISFYCSSPQSRDPVKLARLLRCLALVVKSHRAFLPSEETARIVVGDTFLPYIENDLLRRSIAHEEVSSHSSKRTYGCVCETMKGLLIDPKHSSALLAPLVNDICIDDGKEEQSTNPLRTRLLGAFGKSLARMDVGSEEEQTETCYALATAIQAIEMLDSSIAVIPTEGSNIVKSTESFIFEVIKATEGPDEPPTKYPLQILKSAALRLLKGLISLYPGDVTGLGWKLMIEGCDTLISSPSSFSIERDTSKSPDYQFCESVAFRPDSIHLSNLITSSPATTIDTEICVRAIECLTGFVSALPWKKWLEQDKRWSRLDSNSRSPKRPTSSGLYRRVTTALDKLLQKSLDSFQCCETSTILEALGSLMMVSFKELPFCNGQLIQGGVDLWSSLACCVYDPNENGHRRSVSKDVLLASLGGTTTAKGELVPACVPALMWLVENEASSVSFLDKVLESIKNNDDNSSNSVKLLCTMLRTLPSLAFKRWEEFRNLLDQQSKSDSVANNVVTLEILRAFKSGERDFGFQMKRGENKNEESLRLTCLVLSRTFSNVVEAMTDTRIQCIRLGLEVYGVFLDKDWSLLDATSGEVLNHFQRLLEMCQHPKPSLREAACKAMGEFCTQYSTSIRPQISHLGEKITQYGLIVDKVCSVLLHVCTDQNPKVRSMSTFALGNLAYELRGSDYDRFVNDVRVSEICVAILEGLGDKDDKVVGNSIRSLGHAGNLFVRCTLSESHKGDISTSICLLVQIVDNFAGRISVALDVAMDTKSKSSLTWKQRSAAKKHGWGACHSMGLIFQAINVEIVQTEVGLASSCSNALKQLVLCCTNHDKLNEKVVLGAMAAIGSVPRPVLAELGRETGLVGDALTSSVALLRDSLMSEIGHSLNLKESRSSTRDDRLTKQNQQLLCHLLGSASINDAYRTLTDDGITSRAMNMLYTWMVSQQDALDGDAFVIFALALQRPGLSSSDDVTLEQKFTSRAVQRFKSAGQAKDASNEYRGDDADEL